MQTRERHGEAGHLNVFVRDQESAVTGYGQHARVVAFAPEPDSIPTYDEERQMCDQLALFAA